MCDQTKITSVKARVKKKVKSIGLKSGLTIRPYIYQSFIRHEVSP